MTITVKKEVEETVIVPVPFASKDSCWHYLVTEEFIILATKGHVLKQAVATHPTYVKDALMGEPITIQEAEEVIENCIESLQLKQVA